MKKQFPSITIGLLLCCQAFAAAEKPNIVLIVADDLGYGDLGCFGCKDIPTPHIDGLAKEGVRLTQAYAYNVCSPTRASILTGCYAERSGIHGVLMGKSVPAFSHASTLAKVLHDNGYITGLVGKWHLGYEGDTVPTRMGFDEFFGFHGGKLDYFKHTDSTQKNGTPAGKHDLYEGDTEIFRDGYTTELFTERARKFIRDHASKPFFLEITYNAPHYAVSNGSYEAPPAYLEKFGVKGDPNKTRGGYAAMVSCLDDGVGKVLDELKAQKLEGNTLVWFISDNGAEGAGSNKPLSGAKHTNKEGGIRVPWAARWPGVIPAGTTNNDIVHVMDIMPTLLAVTKSTAPKDHPFDGTNVWNALVNKGPLPERPVCFPPDTIREGQWKFSGGKLYDINADLRETQDVAAQHPDIVAKLNEELARWKKSLESPSK